MNNEDYVSLEVAKLLKEKGYDEPCCKMYNEKEECYEYACYMMTKQGFRNYDLCEYEVSIPTLYEAAKWLRMNHKINITVFFYSKDLGYGATLRNIGDGTDIGEEVKLFDEYEEALNAGILEALKLI